ncbi:hypothetical protein EDM59_23135 [Brevibacillus nitrificans]|uniref:Uncharacterized protein n=1 Tax=Brevibacillus nitrificans TaxID=651560 RepID=A0A3M8CYZ9_9BACL|nr:hypothetical protein [Brevibacillus nitrificans]RNB81082.1 hypothetical protein EDM59_23135 [Brevibacillus nitrificans]
MARKVQRTTAPEKKEWIESAAYLGAEKFEVAGALFHEDEHSMLEESIVKHKLTTYKGGM